MNIEKTITEQHQAKLLVELDNNQIEQEKRRVAKRLSRNTRIPGFRPGKAPYHIIVRYIGEGQILSEAIEGLVDTVYPQAIEEAEISPYGPGKLEDLKIEADPPTAEFVIPLAPEVELGEYKSLRKEYGPPVVSDEDVENFLNEMLEMRADLKPVERGAEEGDQVRIVLDASLEDEEEKLIDNQAFPIVVDAEDDDTSEEWPYPGFSRNLIGMQQEDQKELEYTFPEDFESEQLQGKKASYQVTVTEVNERTLPELDDDFAKSLGNYENLEEYRQDVREHLESTGQERYDSEFEDEILDAIIAKTEFKFPPEAVEDEIKVLKEQLSSRLSSQGLDLETYKKAREIDDDGLDEELSPTAETRIRRSLVLLEIAQQEELQVDQARVEEEVNSALQMMFANMPEAEARKMITDDFVHGLSSRAFNNAIISQTVTYLRDLVSGKLEEQEAAAELDEAEQAEAQEEETAETGPEAQAAEVESASDAGEAADEEIEGDGPEAAAEVEAAEKAASPDEAEEADLVETEAETE